MRLAFDLSSILWTCLLAGKDKEAKVVEFEGKEVSVNSAAYGYENVINLMVAAMKEYKCTPIDCVLVKEGFNSKAPRLAINISYKSGRGKRSPLAYENFQAVRDRVIGVFRTLGAIVVSQDNVEADDVLAFLAVHSKDKLVIVSNDNDLAALDGFNQHGADIITRINGESSGNKYGLFPNKYISLFKAMVGDRSDSISGIVGFGAAAWKSFEEAFGEAGMAEMVRLADLYSLDELEVEAEQPTAQGKIVKKIWEGRKEFLNSWRLASLHPEWVNTIENQLQWSPGLVQGRVDDERLRHWSSRKRLVTGSTFDAFLAWMVPMLKDRPWLSLDIETSTPDESDDWLAAQGDPDGVDVIGSELTGMSLTFGNNMQYTVYISVDHAKTDNVPKPRIVEVLKALRNSGVEVVVHNTNFEGTVLYNEFGEELKDNGYEGLLPNWLDTKFEASYVDENDGLGLKKLSNKWLGYDQVEYKAVTTLEGPAGTVKGGTFKGQFNKVLSEAVYGTADENGKAPVLKAEVTEVWDRHSYKMNELPATHVFDYACDDTICTAAFHNFAKLFMELEGTYEVYKQVEIKASYLHCQSFIHGTKVSLAKLAELSKEDDATYDKAWSTLRDYLISKGWEGTVTPVYSEFSPAAVKESYKIVTGEDLDCRARLPAKMLEALSDAPLLKGAWELALGPDTPWDTQNPTGQWSTLNSLVASRYSNEPEFNAGSPTQMKRLLYDVMGFPIVVFNKPTPAMMAKGEKQGTPKTDGLAIAYALQVATPEQAAALNALTLMKMVATRRSLYYSTFPYFIHWKTGRVHSSHGQCATNTRRASASKPNVQQVSKREAVAGYSPRVREVFVPHKRKAVIVSMDFVSQEILLLAEWSKDPVLREVFVGVPPKDMHSITGVGIFNSHADTISMSYETFVEVIADQKHSMHKTCKKFRGLGKAINFSGQYRVGAKKMASMLFVTEAEAQAMIDAKAEAFPVAEDWAVTEMETVKQTGTVRTMLGAVRHLAQALNSTDKFESSKATRQCLSYRIQGSAAEQTKLAEGLMWEARLEQRFDCEIMFPVHDECVASCAIEDLYEFIPAMHACMVNRYAGMELPIRSSISFGPNFGVQFEAGTEPTREAIQKGLDEIFESEKPKVAEM